MNTRTVLFVAGGVVVAAYLYSRSAAAADGALTVGRGPNSQPRSPAGGIFDVGGFLSVNSQLVVAEKVDAAAGKAICQYYGGGPVCTQAAGVVSKFNAWQTRKSLNVATGVVTDSYQQTKNIVNDVRSGNVVGFAKDSVLAPVNVAKDVFSKLNPF